MTNKYELTQFKYSIGYTEIIILLICILCLALIHYSDLDFIISDYIYETTQWKYTQSFWAETIMHKTTKAIIIIIFLGLVFKLISLIRSRAENHHIYDLFILLLTVVLSIALVSFLKRFFNADCPWDLIRYGGEKPFYSLFDYPENMLPSKHCFPASHASVGYSWLALFFFFKVKNYQHKFKVLFGVLFIGISFGIAQQIRGAHFISHDVWSLIVCLLTAILIYSIAYRKKYMNCNKEIN